MDLPDTIADLTHDLALVVADKKRLETLEKELKAELLEAMRNEGLESINSDEAKVHIQKRSEKDYGEEVRDLEIALKERKKLADDMGDFTIISQKESLVFSLPKSQ
jgi:TRAP-type C4-dicarboxylate transport system substrate-binding protein